LERLVQWLESLDGIDVLHLSSVLLIGLARRIKEALGVPIVCMLQDEDTWIDALDRPYDSACWDAMAEAAGDIDRFVAVSRYCADAMQQRLRLSSSKLGVVPIGIDISGYEAAPLSHEPPVIGYLSKMTPSVGLGDLVDAFIDLKRRPGMERLELRAMGGMVGADRRFIADLRRRLRRQGFANDVRFMPEVDRDSRLRFLRDVSVVSVPARGESFGLFMLEAWAAGVPVVLPRAGAFPELIGSTGGGIVYDVDAPGGLAEALASVVTNPAAAAAMGAAGKRAVEERFTAAHMAANMLKVYTEVRNRE
jgi:glycosyltransferase involved in cell wall biosynthesis